MKPRLFACATAIALLGACATLYPEASIASDWAARRAQWVQQNQNRLTPEVADAIRRGEVIVGMTLEEAYAAWAGWGQPRINRTATASGVTEQYAFRRGTGANLEYRFFYVQNGRVTGVQDSSGRR